MTNIFILLIILLVEPPVPPLTFTLLAGLYPAFWKVMTVFQKKMNIFSQEYLNTDASKY